MSSFLCLFPGSCVPWYTKEPNDTQNNGFISTLAVFLFTVTMSVVIVLNIVSLSWMLLIWVLLNWVSLWCFLIVLRILILSVVMLFMCQLPLLCVSICLASLSWVSSCSVALSAGYNQFVNVSCLLLPPGCSISLGFVLKILFHLKLQSWQLFIIQQPLKLE